MVAADRPLTGVLKAAADATAAGYWDRIARAEPVLEGNGEFTAGIWPRCPPRLAGLVAGQGALGSRAGYRPAWERRGSFWNWIELRCV